MIYYETSAVDGRHVDDAFQQIAQNFVSMQSLGPETADPSAEEPKGKKFDLDA